MFGFSSGNEVSQPINSVMGTSIYVRSLQLRFSRDNLVYFNACAVAEITREILASAHIVDDLYLGPPVFSRVINDLYGVEATFTLHEFLVY